MSPRRILAVFHLYQSMSTKGAPLRPGGQVALRKLGNAQNALGMLYMERAAAVDLAQGEAAVAREKDNWQRSCTRFTQSAQTFGRVADAVNVALVNCNLGKLMRVRCASAVLRGQVAGGPTRQERMLHDKAIEYYQAAMESLQRRGTHPGVWDIVSVELAGAYLAFASLLQGNLGTVDRSVPDLLAKALRLYTEEHSLASKGSGGGLADDGHDDTRRSEAVANKVVEVHHRLAKYHADACSGGGGGGGSGVQNQSCKLADLHYQRAIKMYTAISGATAAKNCFQVHLEAASMHLAANEIAGRYRHLAASLDLLLDSAPALSRLQVEVEGTNAKPGRRGTATGVTGTAGSAACSIVVGDIGEEIQGLTGDTAMLLRELHRLLGLCLRGLLKETHKRGQGGGNSSKKRADRLRHLFEMYLRHMPAPAIVDAANLTALPLVIDTLQAMQQATV